MTRIWFSCQQLKTNLAPTATISQSGLPKIGLAFKNLPFGDTSSFDISSDSSYMSAVIQCSPSLTATVILSLLLLALLLKYGDHWILSTPTSAAISQDEFHCVTFKNACLPCQVKELELCMNQLIHA